MNATLKIFFFTLLVAVSGSCTIQKRTFNKGYHVEWTRKFNQSVEPVPASDEKNDVPVSKEKQPENGRDVKEEGITKCDTADQGVVEQVKSVSDKQSDRDLKTWRKDDEQVRIPVHEKKMTSIKAVQRRAYGRGGGGAKALVFIFIFAILFLLIYAAYSSANYSAMFLLLAAVGWLLIAILIVLFIWMLVRLFMGPYR